MDKQDEDDSRPGEDTPSPDSAGRSTTGQMVHKRVTRMLLAECPRALARFSRLDPGDPAAIAQAAILRLQTESCDDGDIEPGPPVRARVLHALYCEALTVDRIRWVGMLSPMLGGSAPAGDALRRELAFARRKAAEIHQPVVRVVWALEAAAVGKEEEQRVVVLASIACGVSRDVVHQQTSRAWREVASKKLFGWQPSWRGAYRHFVPVPLDLFTAARLFTDACSPDASAALSAVIDELSRSHYRRKSSGEAARAAWRVFLDALSASGAAPSDIAGAIRAACMDAGVDDRVTMASVRGADWTSALARLGSPAVDALHVWRAFLDRCNFGAPAQVAWENVERCARASAAARGSVKEIYETLKDLIEQLPRAWFDARATFLDLVERSTEGEDRDDVQGI